MSAVVQASVLEVYGAAEHLIRKTVVRADNDDAEHVDSAEKVTRGLQVPALHIEDKDGTVFVRRFELAKAPALTSLRGQSTYVQPLRVRAGQSAHCWVEVPCGEILRVVDMLYHSNQLSTLAEYDQQGIAEWFEGMLQREAEAARPHARDAEAREPVTSARDSPHPTAGPSSPQVKQSQKSVRRLARLAAN